MGRDVQELDFGVIIIRQRIRTTAIFTDKFIPAITQLIVSDRKVSEALSHCVQCLSCGSPTPKAISRLPTLSSTLTRGRPPRGETTSSPRVLKGFPRAARNVCGSSRRQQNSHTRAVLGLVRWPDATHLREVLLPRHTAVWWPRDTYMQQPASASVGEDLDAQRSGVGDTASSILASGSCPSSHLPVRRTMILHSKPPQTRCREDEMVVVAGVKGEGLGAVEAHPT